MIHNYVIECTYFSLIYNLIITKSLLTGTRLDNNIKALTVVSSKTLMLAKYFSDNPTFEHSDQVSVCICQLLLYITLYFKAAVFIFKILASWKKHSYRNDCFDIMVSVSVWLLFLVILIFHIPVILLNQVENSKDNLDKNQEDNHQLKTCVVLVFEMIPQKFSQFNTLT